MTIQITNAKRVLERERGDLVDNKVSPRDDASWLPSSRGYTEKVASGGESEKDEEDKIQTKWPKVGKATILIAGCAS